MAGYRLTDEQRSVLDNAVVETVQNGFYALDRIVEEVARLLVARQEPWSIAFARVHDFKRYVKSALKRLKDRGRLANEPAGRHTLWVLPRQLAS